MLKSNVDGTTPAQSTAVQMTTFYHKKYMRQWHILHPTRRPYIITNCEVCGKLFLGKRINSRHCSPFCMNKHYRDAHKEQFRNYCRHHILWLKDGTFKIINKRPWTGICELCGKPYFRMDWHHWDDNHPEWGLWLCIPCHRLVELFESHYKTELIEKYKKLKEMMINGVCIPL